MTRSEFNWKKCAVLGGICLAFTGLARWWLGGQALWLFYAAAFWALAFCTPLALDLVPRFVRQSPPQPTDGMHYQFGGCPIRVRYAEGQVWLATRDLYAALGLLWGREELRQIAQDPRHGRIPGTQLIGIPERHVAEFVARTGAPDAQRFNRWFEREVLAPIRARMARSA